MVTQSLVKQDNVLYGKDIANYILQETATRVHDLKKKQAAPFLMTIEVGKDPASEVYLESQRKVAARVGINYESIELSRGTSQERLIKIIQSLNRDPYINGIIVHVPLPAQMDTKVVQWSISTEKDVEGVTPHNLGRMMLGGEGLTPCTAQAIAALIKSTGTEIKGKEAAIVGHSDIVGKPTALLLLREEATVTICHYATSQRGHLEDHVRNAEILVVAVGKPNLIKGDWIRKGALVVDAGINTQGGHLIGDVEFDKARERAAYITPVPGGVGAVTVAYLMKNTLDAMAWQTAAAGARKESGH